MVRIEWMAIYRLWRHKRNYTKKYRTIFVDNESIPKPAELTLDEKLDDLIDELMKNSRTTAVKKLKRMLNDRL